MKKLAPYVQVGEEQLPSILLCLEEPNPAVRKALHELLSHLNLANVRCLQVCLQALQLGLSKYPEDLWTVLEAHAGLGRSHAPLAALLVPELLRIDPRFLAPEPNVDDVAYAAALAFLTTAAVKSPAVRPLLPSFTQRHLSYLHGKYPGIYPPPEALQPGSTAPSSPPASSLASILPHIESSRCELIKSTEETLKRSRETEISEARSRIIATLKQVRGIISHTPHAPVRLEAIAEHLEMLRAILDIHAAILAEKTDPSDSARRLLSSSYRLQHSHVGFSHSAILTLQRYRLFARAAEARASGHMRLLVSQANAILSFASRHGLPLEAALEQLLKDIVAGRLPPLASLLPPLYLDIPAGLKRPTATLQSLVGVNAPAANAGTAPERPLAFPWFLAPLVRVRGRVDSQPDWVDLVIRVSLPDGSVLTFPLQPSSATPLRPLSWNFSVDISLLLHASGYKPVPWSEPAQVHFSVCRKFARDSAEEGQEEGLLPICEPKPLWIHPK